MVRRGEETSELPEKESDLLDLECPNTISSEHPYVMSALKMPQVFKDGRVDPPCYPHYLRPLYDLEARHSLTILPYILYHNACLPRPPLSRSHRLRVPSHFTQ